MQPGAFQSRPHCVRAERFVRTFVVRLAIELVALLLALDVLAASAAAQTTETQTRAVPAASTPPRVTNVESRERIRYFLERIDIDGAPRTRNRIIRAFVPLELGDVLDVDDPEIEAIRWRLLGTGWFSDVHLRLQRGSRRGWVVLVIHVKERNTLIIEQVTVGVSEGVVSSADKSPDLIPYAGLAVAETNLFGLGMSLSVSGVLSRPQQGLRVRFTDPLFLGSPFLVSISPFFNDAREFFGNNPLVSITCPPLEPDEMCPPEIEAKSAVVFYKRYGLSLGFGHDIGSSTRYTLDYQAELVDVSVLPHAASEERGDETRAIDFAIDDGHSFVSTVQLGLIYDRRDDPALTSRGRYVQFRGDIGSGLLQSDYDFLRLQTHVRQWFPLPWDGHSIRLGLYTGVVFGRAPFFYKFHVSDLSDLIPSRVLEMNLDRRAPPDLLGTAIAVMRNEEIAGRIDIEYGVPLYRGGTGVRAVNAYAGIGLYTLLDPRDLQTKIPGYGGLSYIPLDLTFDLGVRMDTNVGVFQLGFSNLLGFVTP